MTRVFVVLPLLLLLRRVVGDDAIGCYTSVDIAETVGYDQYQTDLLCLESCLDYAYIAIKNGGTCYCLSSKPSDDDETDSSLCNVKCNGYGEATCGGTSTYSVFKGAGTKGLGSSDDDDDDTSSAVESSSTAASSSKSSKASSTATSSEETLTSTEETSSITESPLTSETESSSDEVSTKVITTLSSAADGKIIYKTVTSTSTPTDLSESDESTSSDEADDSGSKSSKVGPIVGGVVGGVGGIILIAAIAFFLIRRRNSDNEEDEEEFYDKDPAGLGRGGTSKSRKIPAALEMPMTNPFVHPSEEITDPRLNPVMMGRRRLSVGSLADEADYSRKILQVANPDNN